MLSCPTRRTCRARWRRGSLPISYDHLRKFCDNTDRALMCFLVLTLGVAVLIVALRAFYTLAQKAGASCSRVDFPGGLFRLGKLARLFGRALAWLFLPWLKSHPYPGVAFAEMRLSGRKPAFAEFSPRCGITTEIQNEGFAPSNAPAGTGKLPHFSGLLQG